NHLDLETTAWLETYLIETQRTVICISHDRSFLSAMADHVLHFEGGTAFAYTGNYESFILQREERRLTQVRQFDKQEKKVASETEYIARNLFGQNTKQAKGRRKLLARMPRISLPPGSEAVMALRLNAGNRSGDRVLETKHATIGVPGRDLIKDVTLVMERGEVIALLGANGAGKSTLIKTLLGEREPVAGEVKLGISTSVAYYRQDLAHLPLDAAIYDVIADMRPLWERRQVQGHLGRFGYTGDEVQRTVGTLSGGERARVALALLTLESANLLVLDEPTNHLDVESIEAMEDAIEEYEGSVLIVSHDRAVLRGLATQVWEVKDFKLHQFPGSFVEWEQLRSDKKAKSVADARAANAAEAERNAKLRAAANAASNAQSRQGKNDSSKQKSGVLAKGNQSSGNNAGAKSNNKAPGDAKKLARAAQKALTDVELRVSTLEGRIAELTTALEDLTLYDTAAGTRKAQELGRSLDEHRDLLDEAMHDWNAAAEQVQQLGSV
ncbi:MAG: ABC-F family ATP-binding cassette domain-containing protein, partial [Gemmatimonadaceae bacterium]